jgi:hypothetical protein
MHSKTRTRELAGKIHFLNKTCGTDGTPKPGPTSGLVHVASLWYVVKLYIL